MDKKQKRAERELLELIRKSSAVRRAVVVLERRWGRAELEASGFDWGFMDALLDLEERARRGLEKLREGKP